MPRPLRPARLLLATSLLGLTGLTACASHDPGMDPDSPAYLVRHGEFDEAVTRARERYEEDPEDEVRLKAYVITAAIYNLHHGRELTFADRDEESMDYFYRAKALAPEAAEIDHWISKTREKIADRRLDEATNALAKGNLDLALKNYRDALRYSPGNILALGGEAEVLVRLNYRAGRGEAYYKEGMRALKQSWLNGASRDFRSAQKYEPEDERAEGRITEVDRERALERMAVAGDFVAQGLFAAARNEYRIAQILNPELEEALEGYRRMDREATVADFLREADMQRRKGNLIDAEILVERARGLTLLQHEFVDLAQEDVLAAQHEILYREAVEFERDGFYEEAVDKLNQLLELASYYKDARTRLELLTEFVDKADALYARAMAAETVEEALPLLRQIVVFWPEYRDAAGRIDTADSEAAAGGTVPE
jgi:tetratricopeptide (TPR) repeat protein